MQKITAVMTAAAALATAGMASQVPAAADKTTSIQTLQAQVRSLAKQVEVLKLVKQVPGPQGQQGVAGRDGKDGQSIVGPAGVPGVAGKNGVDGKDGAAGRDGAPGAAGRDGSGLPSGTTILISGDCPTGMTVQGNAYQWRVYNGNPFTGSGSELWVSSCRVD